MKTGMRVRARWRAERSGSILDIECFVPDDRPSDVLSPEPPPEPLRRIETPVRLEYRIVAGRDLARFLGAVAEGRLVGKRCPGCQKVYVPPRGVCPTCAVLLADEVPVRDTGTVTTFCVVNIPYEGQVMELPYVYANILLDGSDSPLPHLVQGIPVSEVRMGLRVRAEWGELAPTLESIGCFRPTGEPDAAFDSYRDHL